MHVHCYYMVRSTIHDGRVIILSVSQPLRAVCFGRKPFTERLLMFVLRGSRWFRAHIIK